MHEKERRGKLRTQTGKLLITDKVAAVIKGAVPHMQDFAGGKTEQLQNICSHAQYCTFSLRTYVVGLPYPPHVQDDVKRLRDIINIQVRPRCQPCCAGTIHL